MKRAWELQEHREIYEVVKKREETPLNEYISFDDMKVDKKPSNKV